MRSKVRGGGTLAGGFLTTIRNHQGDMLIEKENGLGTTPIITMESVIAIAAAVVTIVMGLALNALGTTLPLAILDPSLLPHPTNTTPMHTIDTTVCVCVLLYNNCI